ncbi:MAG TPA: peptidylprolyl isomerase [Candidatus Lokiarchaeia archaeon]|nr:peptidylprolyl isomerase [Candidatus Lokiarchaeia archaeon]
MGKGKAKPSGKSEAAGGKMRASHILVKKLTQAQQIKDDIEGGADFKVLAEKFSDCPSKKKGGDLGWFTKGSMVPEFETAVRNLKMNEISGPVKTQFGYHIIKRTG